MFRAFPPVLILFALSMPTIAFAAPVSSTPPAIANAALLYPISVVKTEDLDFGLMSSAAAGTVVIDPNANTISSTGGVTLLGSQWHAGGFVGSAGGLAVVVLIKLPNQSIVLTRQGGAETMTVSNFTLQGQNKRILAAKESFTFRVGGTLNVGSSQAEGIYTGTFDVQVQYP